MPSFEIPKSSYEAVQALIHLTPSQFDEMFDRLEETPPTAELDRFIGSVASRVKTMDSAAIQLILPELVKMMYSGYEADVNGTELAAEISIGALEAASPEFPFKPEQKELLQTRLSKAFNSRGLRMTGKAQSVFYDTDKTFFKARILTDLRAIYDERGEEIVGAMVLHNLRIRYFENGDQKDIYLSLDKDHLQQLTEILERASKKQTGLETLMQRASISYVS
jgi:uncharacterized protein (DUF1778 family)